MAIELLPGALDNAAGEISRSLLRLTALRLL